MAVTLAIDPARARSIRLLLLAACRRLQSLEHPSGWPASYNGPQLLTDVVNKVRDALVQLKVEQLRDRG